jgi:hypothetical protein
VRGRGDYDMAAKGGVGARGGSRVWSGARVLIRNRQNEFRLRRISIQYACVRVRSGVLNRGIFFSDPPALNGTEEDLERVLAVLTGLRVAC